ncbi:MAG: preprotein translocase subunit SecG [Gammaproteobacteria bacterium]|nr:MAG: preprotein translocase subunit SecG [Gammaproteobacteria bacterium]
MNTLLLFLHSLLCFVLIGMVMVQRGTGAEMGSGFGAGASQTVFGSKGSASFLTRTTAVLATLFFVSSLSLTYFIQHNQASQSKSIMSQTPVIKKAVIEHEQGASDTPSVPEPVMPEAPKKEDIPSVPAE